MRHERECPGKCLGEVNVFLFPVEEHLPRVVQMSYHKTDVGVAPGLDGPKEMHNMVWTRYFSPAANVACRLVESECTLEPNGITGVIAVKNKLCLAWSTLATVQCDPRVNGAASNLAVGIFPKGQRWRGTLIGYREREYPNGRKQFVDVRSEDIEKLGMFFRLHENPQFRTDIPVRQAPSPSQEPLKAVDHICPHMLPVDVNSAAEAAATTKPATVGTTDPIPDILNMIREEFAEQQEELEDIVSEEFATQLREHQSTATLQQRLIVYQVVTEVLAEERKVLRATLQQEREVLTEDIRKAMMPEVVSGICTACTVIPAVMLLICLAVWIGYHLLVGFGELFTLIVSVGH